MGELKKGSLDCRPKFSPPTPFLHRSNWVKEPTIKNAPDGMYGDDIWTDGTDIYYSNSLGEQQYVLRNNTWERKEWNISGLTASCIWTDGTDIYFSRGDDEQYVLKNGNWEPKEWKGDIPSGGQIWSDGTNIYYSSNGAQYVLIGDTWEKKKWKVPSSSCLYYSSLSVRDLYGDRIWSDGTNIYYCCGPDSRDEQFVLNGDTWSYKTWEGLNPFGNRIWTDGTNIYHSYAGEHHILKDGVWIPHEWSGATPTASNIWSDGTNIYLNQFEAYMLGGGPTEVYVLGAINRNPTAMLMGFQVGQALRRMRK